MDKQSILVTALLVTSLFEIGSASAESLGKKRLKLFADCQPVHVVVEELTEAEKEIGLTRKQIMTAAESRLRPARIFSEELALPLLDIAVTVVGRAFNITLLQYKGVKDSLSGEEGNAITWIRAVNGTHSSDRTYILSVLSTLLDEFIAEYYRVNQDACERK